MTFAPNANDRLWKDPEQNGKFNLPSLLRYLILILVILCLILGAWYLFSPHRPRLNEAALPLIQADGTPYKVKAQDQGIPAIKHQDKLVYGRIRNDQNTPTVEHILPDPEPPLAHTKDENSTVKMVDQYIPEEIQLEASKIAAPQMTSIDDLLEDLPEENGHVFQQNIRSF
jgi:cbb3-type cytochrome oxidase subunit 3